MQENIYGHLKRLNWILSHLKKSDLIFEFGCGTGYMMTRPLAKLGYNVTGLDIDRDSITLGKTIFLQEGLDPDRLRIGGISDLDHACDVIIASEVLEHLENETLEEVLDSFHRCLKPHGRLLVTVPNGYGWFELESFLWRTFRLGRISQFCGVADKIAWLKTILLRKQIVSKIPASLSSSPHLRKFTWQGLTMRLLRSGFRPVEMRGSVLFCGPVSNLLFDGFNTIMKINLFLGEKLPGLASGFFVAAKKNDL